MDKLKANKDSTNASPNTFITQRKKTSSTDEMKELFKCFKDEISSMLNSWKNEIIEKLVQDVKTLKHDVKEMQKINLDLEKSIEFLSNTINDRNKKLEILEKENQANQQCLEVLENQMYNLQQKQRANILEIRNLPKKENEDLKDIFGRLCETIRMPIEDSQLINISRNPGPASSVKPVSVELKNSELKYRLIKAVKSYNEKNKQARLNSCDLGIASPKVIVNSIIIVYLYL
ncbi:unnamed protein product [Colias eurytheme]|nr:unnamed protein product [Colias eurytheme]